MCGGAIISDFVSVKRGRKPTTEDLWSELDSLSDFLGLDHRSMNNINNGSKKENLSNLKLAQKPRQPNQGNQQYLFFLILFSGSFLNTSELVFLGCVFFFKKKIIILDIFNILRRDLKRKKEKACPFPFCMKVYAFN